jgi:hypothetical protein
MKLKITAATEDINLEVEDFQEAKLKVRQVRHRSMEPIDAELIDGDKRYTFNFDRYEWVGDILA